MPKRVYIETTIPSYLAAWRSRDLRQTARQEITLTTTDEVIVSVRKIKESLAEPFGFDVRRILEDARTRERSGDRDVLSPPLAQTAAPASRQ